MRKYTASYDKPAALHGRTAGAGIQVQILYDSEHGVRKSRLTQSHKMAAEQVPWHAASCRITCGSSSIRKVKHEVLLLGDDIASRNSMSQHIAIQAKGTEDTYTVE